MRFRARSKFKEARGNGAWIDEAGRRGRETMSTLRTGCVADPPRVFQTRTHLHRKRRSSHEFFIRSLSFPLLPSTAPPHPSPPLPFPRSPPNARRWPPPLIIVRWLSIFERRNSRFYLLHRACTTTCTDRVSFFGKLGAFVELEIEYT